ncbi:MAG: hypothetical protein WC052_02930 [Patescibacteria group bacterium]|jgi:hypothetical protein
MMHSHEQSEQYSPDSVVSFHIELNAKALEEARRLVADPEHKFRNASKIQAEHMAESADIEVSSGEVSLYCALREPFPVAPTANESQESEQGARPDQLSDQHILAAVLELSGDEARLKKFTEFYPAIFIPEQ